MKFPKIGIYFSHYECFGHFAHVIAIAEVFKKRFPKGDLFFIQAGKDQPKAKFNQLGKVYTLPDPFVDRQEYRKINDGLSSKTELRAKCCLDILDKEKPDLFITELFPLSREESRHELIPSLLHLLKQGVPLWSIAGYPLLTGKNIGWKSKLLKEYQKIIILSPQLEKRFIAKSFSNLVAKEEYLEFFKQFAQKIKFTGYLIPRQEVVKDDGNLYASKASIPEIACKVAVVRGGGAVYPKVIAQAIRASELLGREFYFSIVAGPSTTFEEWSLFRTLVDKKKINNVTLYRALGDYEGLIKKSDICVALASYNTSVMLFKYKKKALLIPFEGYGLLTHHEQPARAAFLRKTLKARVISYQELTAKALAVAIEDISAVNVKNQQISSKWFTGAKVLDEQLKELFLP